MTGDVGTCEYICNKCHKAVDPGKYKPGDPCPYCHKGKIIVDCSEDFVGGV
jgi:DNA-directed RNA polymerase subunit RPC12/RpoP